MVRGEKGCWGRSIKIEQERDREKTFVSKSQGLAIFKIANFIFNFVLRLLLIRHSKLAVAFC